MKKGILALLCTWAVLIALAQDDEKPDEPKYWTQKASLGLNFTNVSLTNWAGGGSDALSISGVFAGKEQYKKDNVTWLNTLEIGYGKVKNQGIEAFRKSDDRFIFVSKYARGFGAKHLAYSGLLDFRTQMDKGINYFERDGGLPDSTHLISRLLAPGYLTVAAGLEYKPTDNFYFMLSPISGKMTFVMDDALSALGAFGVEPGKKSLIEFGAVASLRWYWEPFSKSESKLGKAFKNVSYETKLNAFQAYKKKKATDFIWDHTLVFKANDYISSTFSAQFIYDEDVDVAREDGSVGPVVQQKTVLAIGFLFNIL